MNTKITDIVLDFDGTCTVIPQVYEDYLQQFLEELNSKVFPQQSVKPEEWNKAQDTVRANSPAAGWTLLGPIPSAPAAADPYILAFEASKLILKQRNSTITVPPAEIHQDCYAKHQAPWRPEAREVFNKLLSKGIRLHFITNSDKTAVTNRVLDLMNVTDLGSHNISVNGSAAKFIIGELQWYPPAVPSIPDHVKLKFEELRASVTSFNIGRPVYLRRPSFFNIIYQVFNELNTLGGVVFCGDVWELDLAMPAHLGAKIHLVKRAWPFNTYPYEEEATNAAKGKISDDLKGLLEWV